MIQGKISMKNVLEKSIVVEKPRDIQMASNSKKKETLGREYPVGCTENKLRGHDSQEVLVFKNAIWY